MLIDAYQKVMASPRLARVKLHAYGDRNKLESGDAWPRVLWLPTSDRLAPPDTLGRVPGVIDGKRAIATSIATRLAGADVHLFTGADLQGLRDAEELLNDFLVALHEELLSWSNYEVTAIRWTPPGAISQATTLVLVSLAVKVPVWQTDPAQLVSGAAARLK